MEFSIYAYNGNRIQIGIYRIAKSTKMKGKQVMKCLDCGMEMEQGTAEAIGQGGGHWYEFTSDEEKKKTGLKGFFTMKTISVETSALESPAWHCPKCKKILIWIDSKE